MKHQLQPNEITAALSGIDRTSNLWRAFMSMIEQSIEGEIGAVCNSELNDSTSHFNRGRFSMIQDFKAACNSYMDEAEKIRFATDNTK